MTAIVETVVKLRKDGHKVVLVSSGAIGIALRRMDLEKRPKHLSQIQALAAIGQCRLMSLWDQLFTHLRQPVAQILLTRNDIADRTQYLNAQSTFSELLSMGVIPIVNENDTLAVAEIKFGDNDTLSAITAAMVQADFLFLMTDVDCLYDKNPRLNPEARPVEVVRHISELDVDVSTAGSGLGTGGMSTKIVAARLATSAGVTTVVTKSSRPGNIIEILRYLGEEQGRDHGSAETIALGEVGPPLHTRFLPEVDTIRDRYFWLLYGLAPHGTIYIDQGAAKALSEKAGLLPVGVVEVDGNFAQQEAVKIVVVDKTNLLEEPKLITNEAVDKLSHEIGRALVNYSSVEIKRIRGLKSTEIRSVLGYADSEYVAFRENMAFFKANDSTQGVDGVEK